MVSGYLLTALRRQGLIPDELVLQLATFLRSHDLFLELRVRTPDVQARMFTLAPADVIPWHEHSECVDHYFVLRGALTIETRNPDDRCVLQMGDRQQIRPGTTHLISNGGAEDCEFLLIQGVGKYDWIKADR